MYTNYNIPQKGYSKPQNYNYSKNYSPNSVYYNNDDRFIGGGFLAPFVLGGVGGYLLGRPNYNQGPIPVYFPPQSRPFPPYYPY